jgi:exonuclease SbcC
VDAELSLHVIDNDMGEEHRAIRSLSGGERFIVSLSLALSLSGLEGREFSVDTLFIDEGFGSLDADTLDIAITALETLHSRGRKVGVITHVAAMIDSIPVQIRVEKLGGGSSVVRPQSADLSADQRQWVRLSKSEDPLARSHLSSLRY